MRVGQNPKKSIRADAVFAPVVLAVVTHLPNTTTAYHAKRFEVIKTCFETMLSGVNYDYSLMVWDNGSIPEFKHWLQFELKPDFLMLSENIGKTSARTAMVNMIPPQSVFAYSDDDMFFYDNWLIPQMELLQEFPNVSVVTGYPVRTSFRWGNENTKRWAMENAKLEIGRFIPQEYEDDFAVSVGRTPEWHKEYSKDDLDYRITYNNKQAYATAHHCQFIGYAETVRKYMSYADMAMDDEKPFDIYMDKLGLRLSTIQRYARHIGNVLDDEIKKEILYVGA